MKLLHTADWHIGKKTEEYSRLDEQAATIEQIAAIADREQVDGIIIAGDIYDRSVPSVEAIQLYRTAMEQLNLTAGYPIFAVSGNHDSAERLEEGKGWYERANYHLATTIDDAFRPIRLGNVQLFLLPFMHPHAIRRYFADDSLTSIRLGMKRIVEKMESLFDEDCYHVLVTHYFVEGSLRTDSETTSSVGGLDNIHQGLFQAFDYIALGHLHSPDAIQTGNARYSGSLLKYSLSERNQRKGVYVIDFPEDGTDITIQFQPFETVRDLTAISGTMAELMTHERYLAAEDQYVGITIEDKGAVMNMAQRLRTRFPYLLSIERKYPMIQQAEMEVKLKEMPAQDALTLAQSYYQTVMDEELTAQQVQWLKEAIEEVEMEEQRCDQSN